MADDPNAPTLERETSRLLNAIDKVVISDSLTPEQTKPWQNNTHIISRADAHKQITQLKQQSGKDIWVFGSRTLWSDLLANDLVDELHLMIGPVVLGAGTPTFDSQPSASLRLIDNSHLGWLREHTRSMRGPPPLDVNVPLHIIVICLNHLLAPLQMNFLQPSVVPTCSSQSGFPAVSSDRSKEDTFGDLPGSSPMNFLLWWRSATTRQLAWDNAVEYLMKNLLPRKIGN